MIEVCAACHIPVNPDTKFCTICQEPVGTIMAPDEECPHGGDNTDCGNCAYSPEFAWDDDAGDCMRCDKK